MKDTLKLSRLMYTNLSKDNDEYTETFNCDYYDCNEFIALRKTLPKKQFSLFHSNIQSLKANSLHLATLLNNLNHNFDVISLTETWHTTNPNHIFIPDSLDSYYPFTGIPGTTRKSGAGFFIKKDINFINRYDLDSHYYDGKNEYTAKWIEIINEKENI